MTTYNRMVVDLHRRREHNTRDEAHVDRLFHALSDATRRDIVTLVLDGEHSVSDLARRYPMSFAAVQKHVAVLEGAGLVTKRRRGREQLVSGAIDTVREANRLLDEWEQRWRMRLERMAELLAEPDQPHPREGIHR